MPANFREPLILPLTRISNARVIVVVIYDETISYIRSNAQNAATAYMYIYIYMNDMRHAYVDFVVDAVEVVRACGHDEVERLQFIAVG